MVQWVLVCIFITNKEIVLGTLSTVLLAFTSYLYLRECLYTKAEYVHLNTEPVKFPYRPTILFYTTVLGVLLVKYIRSVRYS
jgi:hypothetical protein